MEQSSGLGIADDFSSPVWDLRGATEICPETPAELHQFIRTYCRTETGQKVIVPVRRMCAGHNAPFEFVSDAFFGIYLNQLVLALRTGAKTFNFALLDFLESWHYGREVPLHSLTIGAVEDQAHKCFSYCESLWRQPEFIWFAHNGRGILKESITLNSGSTIETGVATVKRVNGPHLPRLHLDEWELWDWDIGQQAFSIPKSAGPHKAAVRIASTRKYAFGNMQRFLEEAPARGFKVYKWCIWEVIEQCRDRECSACPILNFPDREGGELCGGRAKDARGFYSIDDFIAKAKVLDRKTLEEEWLCLRPSREGIVFGREYNEDLHRVRHEIPFDPALPLYVTIDQGFTNPFAVLIAQMHGSGEELRFIDELYATEMIPEAVARMTADRLEALGVPEDSKFPVVFDAEDPAAARTFAKHFASSSGKRYHAMLRRPAGKVDIDEWLRLCRRRLKIQTGRPPRLVISSRLHWLPWELTQYRYPKASTVDRPIKETPLDKDNHLVSAWYRLEAWLHKPGKASSATEHIM